MRLRRTEVCPRSALTTPNRHLIELKLWRPHPTRCLQTALHLKASAKTKILDEDPAVDSVQFAFMYADNLAISQS